MGRRDDEDRRDLAVGARCAARRWRRTRRALRPRSGRSGPRAWWRPHRPGSSTDATLWPASASASSSSVRSSSPRAQMRIVLAVGRMGMLGAGRGMRASVYGRRRPALPRRPGTRLYSRARLPVAEAWFMFTAEPLSAASERASAETSQTHREEVDGTDAPLRTHAPAPPGPGGRQAPGGGREGHPRHRQRRWQPQQGLAVGQAPPGVRHRPAPRGELLPHPLRHRAVRRCARSSAACSSARRSSATS